MTDEQIKSRIQHVKDLMDIHYRTINDKINQVENNSENSNRMCMLFMAVVIIVVTIASFSATSNKRELKTAEIQQEQTK